MKQWVLCMVLPFLFGCAFNTPLSGPNYQSGAALEAVGITEVVVSLTEAELKRNRDARDLFWKYVDDIDVQLETQPGLIASSKRVTLFGQKAWTMTIWQDQAALMAFVQSDVHQIAARRTPDMITDGRFATFVMASRELPLDWDTALDRLQTEGRPMLKFVRPN